MRLSPHFLLSEFTRSDTATALGIKNDPLPEHLENLKYTAGEMEKVRSVLNDKPILLTSGYRNPTLNKAVGGVANSDHPKGYAADFHCYAFGSDAKVAQAIADSDLEFDQLIYEVWQNGTTVLHISFNPRMRRQVFTEKKTPKGKINLSGIVV